MEQSALLWPPEYNVKTSLKAKHVRLTICKHKGLEVTIPNRVKNFDILALLEEKKLWILKHLAAKQATPISIPNNIKFPLIKKNWDIIYQNIANKKISIKTYVISNKLIISGDLTIQKSVIAALIKWCKVQAKLHLPSLLSTLGTQHQLLCNNITIKNQRTLWGSCSSSNNINLNYKLLFLPEHLAIHVMLHELAHIKHKHHKTRFWDFLTKLDPLCDQHNKMLRIADKLMPDWV
jgi:predicted metal-dependent hydrolase